MQLCSAMLMKRTIMNMVAVICWTAWMKLDKINVAGIVHIMFILIVYLSMICHTYNI